MTFWAILPVAISIIGLFLGMIKLYHEFFIKPEKEFKKSIAAKVEILTQDMAVLENTIEHLKENESYFEQEINKLQAKYDKLMDLLVDYIRDKD